METHPLDVIVRDNASRFKNLAMRVVHNREDAEDVVQEAYLLAFRKFAQFQGRSKLSTWVSRIVINAAYMHVRRQPKLYFISLDDKPTGVNLTCEDVLSSPQRAAEQIMSEREDKCHKYAATSRMVASLAPLQQKLIHLRFVEELTSKQMATRLRITLPAAKARIHRTLYDLREQAKAARL